MVSLIEESSMSMIYLDSIRTVEHSSVEIMILCSVVVAFPYGNIGGTSSIMLQSPPFRCLFMILAARFR